MNRIGGRDSHDLTVNILKRVISNEVALQYSWAGKLKKLGFKDLLLAKCIIRKFGNIIQLIYKVQYLF